LENYIHKLNKNQFKDTIIKSTKMKMTFFRYAGSVIMVCVFLNSPILAQGDRQSDGERGAITIAANPEYDKVSKVKRIMFGEHYRKEWATPVDVEILDMNAFAGGLTPVKMGGGLQTKSLRLEGADGKEYVLRSVNKDPSKAIVAELKGTFAEDVVQDQISSANPFAPMVVASLAETAGILHSKPRLVFVPKTARLGEFENTFGESLCLLEERPSGEFGNSKNVVNSEKLFEKIFTNSNHQVDEKSFLKARLFDMLIGDWDRHEDQWLWASYKEGDKTIYRPIPRDRDQAFANMDGIIPQLATSKWALRQVQDFDFIIHDIKGLNVNGGQLDRSFTTRLTLNEWTDVAKQLQDAITNDAIDAAFREMPEPIYAISGIETVAKLKQRRDDLVKYASSYYKFLSEQVNVVGTNEKEMFEVSRLNNNSTRVIVYKQGEGNPSDTKIFERTFLRSETKEIRLYGLGGKDLFHLNGNVSKGLLVRIIGGKGVDTVDDQSRVKQMGAQTKLYDDNNNIFNTYGETRKYISNDSLKNGYNRKSFVLNWLAPLQAPGYNADDGFFVGAAVVFKKQQFGKAPYGYMQTIGGNYAFATGAYSIWYKGIFREFIGKSDLHLSAKYYSPTYTRNYFGLGNETTVDENAGKDYYRVRMSEFNFSSSLTRTLNKKHTIAIGTGFQSIRLRDNDGRFITTGNAKLDSSDYERKNYGSLGLAYTFNTLDNPLYPKKGIKFNAGGSYIRKIDAAQENFSQMFSEAAFYASVGRFTLASRTGVSTNIGGDYEFFHANVLGGLNNLRGFRKDRFAGKTSFYQNTELRYGLGSFNAYVTKGSWGVLGFFDNGRVWMPGENSNNWHFGYGGGIWFLPFNKMAFTATYGASKEDQLITIKTGFLF